MANKTITLEDDIHIKLSQIQLDLRKIGIEKKLHEINDVVMRNGIDEAFEIIKNNNGVI